MKVDDTCAGGQAVSRHLVNRFRSSADKFVGLADKTFFEITSFEVYFSLLCDGRRFLLKFLGWRRIFFQGREDSNGPGSELVRPEGDGCPFPAYNPLCEAAS